MKTFRGATPQAMADLAAEKRVRLTNEVFMLFGLGSQFDHLILRALAKLGVFCIVADPAKVTMVDVCAVQPTGIILSGGPASVHAEPPPFDDQIFDLGIPILGICLGFQMWARHIGAKVVAAERREFGQHELEIVQNRDNLLTGCGSLRGSHSVLRVLQNHGDRVEQCSKADFQVLGRTENAPIAAARFKHLYGVQFHPEVHHTEDGQKIFHNFVFRVCRAQQFFPAAEQAELRVAQLRQQIGNKRVLLALSGGSDSAVVLYLLKRAVDSEPYRVRAVYIKGIDRPDDLAHVQDVAAREQVWLDLRVVDATGQFLLALKNIQGMADKRIAVRGVYKEILEEEIRTYQADFIAQGTLITDLTESGLGLDSTARKAQIKLHHNVNLGFSVPELTPLDRHVKDNARDLGREIGAPETLLVRHPFPGPGMVVRVEGEVTPEKLAIAQKVDDIFIQALREAGLYQEVWQAGAVVTQSVCTHTKGDDSGMGRVVALWAVNSVDGFTATPARLSYDFLEAVAQKITNNVREVSSVVYRISGKPPATIEWG